MFVGFILGFKDTTGVSVFAAKASGFRAYEVQQPKKTLASETQGWVWGFRV